MESHGDDEEDELALLTKNFHKFLKKVGKKTKSRVAGSKAAKSKKKKKKLDLLTFLTEKVVNVESVKVTVIFNQNA